jgi:hypothetical protein
MIPFRMPFMYPVTSQRATSCVALVSSGRTLRCRVFPAQAFLQIQLSLEAVSMLAKADTLEILASVVLIIWEWRCLLLGVHGTCHRAAFLAFLDIVCFLTFVALLSRHQMPKLEWRQLSVILYAMKVIVGMNRLCRALCAPDMCTEL